jgi:hypothetical protein
MSEEANDRPRRLLRFYSEYGPSRFKKRSGEPVKLRSLQNAAKRLRLPLIHVGPGEPLIDPVAGDARLAEYAQHQELEPARPRRGRPRAA